MYLGSIRKLTLDWHTFMIHDGKTAVNKHWNFISSMTHLKIWFAVCVHAGSGHLPEQMEAGFQAGRLRPGLVRRLPLLLCHDRVQRLHLRQPAHVHRDGGHGWLKPKPQRNHSDPSRIFIPPLIILDLSTAAFPPFLPLLAPHLVILLVSLISVPRGTNTCKCGLLSVFQICPIVARCRSWMPLILGITCSSSRFFISSVHLLPLWPFSMPLMLGTSRIIRVPGDCWCVFALVWHCRLRQFPKHFFSTNQNPNHSRWETGPSRPPQKRALSSAALRPQSPGIAFGTRVLILFLFWKPPILAYFAEPFSYNNETFFPDPSSEVSVDSRGVIHIQQSTT